MAVVSHEMLLVRDVASRVVLVDVGVVAHSGTAE